MISDLWIKFTLKKDDVWEKIHIFIIHHIVLPLFCMWLGRYFNKIRKKGDFGRSNITYVKE